MDDRLLEVGRAGVEVFEVVTDFTSLGATGFGVCTSCCGGAGLVVGVWGAGLVPPMLREIVGAGFGASACAGRSSGGGGFDSSSDDCCCACKDVGALNECPGTNSKAFALSLDIVTLSERR